MHHQHRGMHEHYLHFSVLLHNCVTELKNGDNVHAFRDAGDALGTLILKYSSKEEMFNVIENMDQFVHIIID